jgi:hypothetical protein
MPPEKSSQEVARVQGREFCLGTRIGFFPNPLCLQRKDDGMGTSPPSHQVPMEPDIRGDPEIFLLFRLPLSPPFGRYGF